MSTNYDRPSPWTGWIVFAVAVMFIVGAVDVIQGLAALLKSTVYVLPEKDLLVTTNYDAWGWALIIWGVVLMLSAASLFGGGGWGRWFAIIVIIINAIVQIAFFPAYPLWSLLVIGLQLAVLWALTAGWSGARAELRG